MSRVAFAALAALVVSAVAVRSEAQRFALWRVVESCVLDHEMTGAALPCLHVDTSGGDDRGFVILQPPFGSADTILSPTRRIVGMEDPWLRSDEAPNYFEDAWEARNWLPTPERKLNRDDFAFAVNSPYLRSQDQLHIHMGCATPLMRQVVEAAKTSLPRLSAADWTLLPGATPGADVWARLVLQDSLAGVNVFRLAVEGVPDPQVQHAQSILAVAGVTLADGRTGFILLAPHALTRAPRSFLKAESFVDSSCRSL